MIRFEFERCDGCTHIIWPWQSTRDRVYHPDADGLYMGGTWHEACADSWEQAWKEPPLGGTSDA